MNKLIALGASNSQQSINKTLAIYAASQINEGDIQVLDLNDYEMPIYSVEREKKNGIPEKALRFINEIENSSGIVISLAEYNGSYSSAFKNIYDWVSRGSKKVWADKPMFIMATSPGPRGGATVFETAKMSFPYMGAKVEASFILPSFYNNYSKEKGITEEDLKSKFNKEIIKFKNVLNKEMVV